MGLCEKRKEMPTFFLASRCCSLNSFSERLSSSAILWAKARWVLPMVSVSGEHREGGRE